MPKHFPLPYRENFESYSAAKQARYFSDTTGAYEVQKCRGGRLGLCYEQVVDRSPIHWHFAAETLPVSLIGDADWMNYRVDAEVFFPAPAEAVLLGRVQRQDQQSGEIVGYQLHLRNDGLWRLTKGNHQLLASGKVILPMGTWHKLSLEFRGAQIQPRINQKKLTIVRDASCPQGLAGIGVAGWQKIQFDEFSVQPIS